MNWFVLVPVGIVLVLFIVFMIVRNLKDEKEFEEQMNNDYRKSKDEEGDINAEEILK